MHRAGSVVIRIEQKRILRDRRHISGEKFLEDKRFEKPRRMRQMPFRRANIGHRLHNAVFRLQACAECAGEVSDLMKTSKHASNTP